MNTKQIVWQFFQKYLVNVVAKQLGQTELTFDQLMFLLHKFAHVYDNRTCKNYIECMIDNGWLIPDNPETIYDIFGKHVVTSLYKYRHTKFTIDINATYDLINEDQIIAEYFKNQNQKPYVQFNKKIEEIQNQIKQQTARKDINEMLKQEQNQQGEKYEN